MKVLEIGKRIEGKLSLDVGFQIRECPPFRRNGSSHSRGCAWQDYLRRSALLRGLYRKAGLAKRHRRPSGGSATGSMIALSQATSSWNRTSMLWISATGSCKGHPMKATAIGGRKERPTEGDDCYGHYNAIFHYPDDVTVSFSSTQL